MIAPLLFQVYLVTGACTKKRNCKKWTKCDCVIGSIFKIKSKELRSLFQISKRDGDILYIWNKVQEKRQTFSRELKITAMMSTSSVYLSKKKSLLKSIIRICQKSLIAVFHSSRIKMCVFIPCLLFSKSCKICEGWIPASTSLAQMCRPG